MRKTEQNTIRVWDLPVRLFHWSLVILFGFSWWSGKEGGNAMEWHMLSGYAILSLVLFRVIWGFAGSTTARFGSFLRGPAAMRAYAASLLSRKPSLSRGHNPLGGLVAVLMLLGLTLQAGSGLFSNDDIFNEGPLAQLISKDLSDQITGFHQTTFNVILTLVSLHVAAVLFYWLYKKENLLRPMLTGRKAVREDAAGESLRFASPWLALAALCLCAGAIYALVKWA